MSGFSVFINDKVDFPKITEEVKQVINAELEGFGLETVADAKFNCPVDEGFLKNSITYHLQTFLLSVEIIVSVNYAAYIEFGTGLIAEGYLPLLPAEWQAFAAQFKGSGGGMGDFFIRILEWVKRKGIPEAAAYPIARKILRYGVKPHPYLYPAIVKNVPLLIDNLKRQLG